MINFLLSILAGFGTYMALDFANTNWITLTLPGHASAEMIQFSCAFIVGVAVLFRGD